MWFIDLFEQVPQIIDDMDEDEEFINDFNEINSDTTLLQNGNQDAILNDIDRQKYLIREITSTLKITKFVIYYFQY